jgi:hypothetical protein
MTTGVNVVLHSMDRIGHLVNSVVNRGELCKEGLISAGKDCGICRTAGGSKPGKGPKKNWLPWLIDWNDFTCKFRASSVGRRGKQWSASGVGVPAKCCELLSKEQVAATGVAASQAKSTWLVSGAISDFNFLQKINA